MADAVAFNLNPGLASDVRSLDALKGRAATDARGSTREVARQFESLFMREVLKSMREATMKSGLTESDGADLGNDMLDDQLAQQLAGLPRGLTDAIERQLTRLMNPGASASTGPATRASADAAAPKPVALSAPQQRFVSGHWPAAQRAAQDSGIPPAYLLGLAGLETGWGRKPIAAADGTPSHNLFAIKAGPRWTGRTVDVPTTEYVDGQPRKVVARFRAYESTEAAFRDFAQLLARNPRYAQARQAVASADGWAQGLQRGGYATDPAYAQKLSQAIQTTLRVQRALA